MCLFISLLLLISSSQRSQVLGKFVYSIVDAVCILVTWVFKPLSVFARNSQWGHLNSFFGFLFSVLLNSVNLLLSSLSCFSRSVILQSFSSLTLFKCLIFFSKVIIFSSTFFQILLTYDLYFSFHLLLQFSLQFYPVHLISFPFLWSFQNFQRHL